MSKKIFCVLAGLRSLGQIFIMHGGLFSDSEITIEQLNAIDRFKEPSDIKLFFVFLHFILYPFLRMVFFVNSME